MNCNDRYDNLILYLDGELDPAAFTELETHFGECDLCRNRLKALESVHSCLYNSLSKLEESPGITDAVIAALPRRRKFTALKWITASGFAATVCVFIWLNISTLHKPVKQIILPEKMVVRAEVQSKPEVPATEAKPVTVSAVVRNKPIAKSPLRQNRQHKPSAIKQQPEPVSDVREPAITEHPVEPKTTPMASVSGVGSVNLHIEQSPAVTDEHSTRTCTVIKANICGIEITHTRETVTLQPQPVPDAETIERPPLQTVVTPVDPGAQVGS